MILAALNIFLGLTLRTIGWLFFGVVLALLVVPAAMMKASRGQRLHTAYCILWTWWHAPVPRLGIEKLQTRSGHHE